MHVAVPAKKTNAGGAAVGAFLRQITHALPHGTQNGAAAEWLLNCRAGQDSEELCLNLPCSSTISVLKTMPLISVLQVSLGPTTLLSLVHSWLTLATPSHLCVVSAVTPRPSVQLVPDGCWWHEPAEVGVGFTDVGSASWPPGLLNGPGTEAGDVGFLPILLRDAGGVTSLSDVGCRIRAAVETLQKQHEVESRLQQGSGRHGKKPARWKGKAAEAAAAARVDVHHCWQRIADALLSGPPSTLQAVCLVQLSTLPLQYLTGQCFQATIPQPMSPPPHEAGAASFVPASTLKLAWDSAQAWQELLAFLTTGGYGVLLRGTDLAMPLCGPGGSQALEHGSVSDAPKINSWFLLLPDDKGSIPCNALCASDTTIPESRAVQGLLYRVITRDGIAGSAAFPCADLRSHSHGGDAVVTCGGSPYAASGLTPATIFSASPLSAKNKIASQTSAGVVVATILQRLRVAAVLNPLDLSAGVGAGHRAFVAQVELAASFASAVVATGLLDVLQPQSNSLGRTRKPAQARLAAMPSSKELPAIECSDDDQDSDDENARSTANLSASASASVSSSSISLSRRGPEKASIVGGFGSRTSPLPPPPAAAAVLAQMLRNRRQCATSSVTPLSKIVKPVVSYSQSVCDELYVQQKSKRMSNSGATQGLPSSEGTIHLPCLPRRSDEKGVESKPLHSRNQIDLTGAHGDEGSEDEDTKIEASSALTDGKPRNAPHSSNSGQLPQKLLRHFECNDQVIDTNYSVDTDDMDDDGSSSALQLDSLDYAALQKLCDNSGASGDGDNRAELCEMRDEYVEHYAGSPAVVGSTNRDQNSRVVDPAIAGLLGYAGRIPFATAPPFRGFIPGPRTTSSAAPLEGKIATEFEYLV